MSQQLTLQINTKTLIKLLFLMIMAIPASILLTLAIILPSIARADNTQTANANPSFSIPAGYALVPASSGNVCSSTSSGSSGTLSPVVFSSFLPSTYTSTITQTNTETNNTTNNTNSFNTDSFNNVRGDTNSNNLVTTITTTTTTTTNNSNNNNVTDSNNNNTVGSNNNNSNVNSADSEVIRIVDSLNGNVVRGSINDSFINN